MSDGLATYVVIGGQPERVVLDAKPDMTAWELSTILPFFLGKMMNEVDWNALGVAQRHLKRAE